jgi:hypothetical protein
MSVSNEKPSAQYDPNGYSLAWHDLPRIHDVRHFDRRGDKRLRWPGLWRPGDMILGLDDEMREDAWEIQSLLSPEEAASYGGNLVVQKLIDPAIGPTTDVYDFSIKQRAQHLYRTVDRVRTADGRTQLIMDMAPSPKEGDYLMLYENKFLEVTSSLQSGPDQNRVIAAYGCTLPEAWPLLWKVMADVGLAGEVSPYPSK